MKLIKLLCTNVGVNISNIAHKLVCLHTILLPTILRKIQGTFFLASEIVFFFIVDQYVDYLTSEESWDFKQYHNSPPLHFPSVKCCDTHQPDWKYSYFIYVQGRESFIFWADFNSLFKVSDGLSYIFIPYLAFLSWFYAIFSVFRNFPLLFVVYHTPNIAQ